MINITSIPRQRLRHGASSLAVNCEAPFDAGHAVPRVGLTDVAQRFDYLLLSRFVVINTAAFAALAVAWGVGWVEAVIEGDRSRLTFAIFATFVVGLAFAARAAVKMSRELNLARRGGELPSAAKIQARLGIVSEAAETCSKLGLLGTIVGIILSALQIDPGAVSDVSKVAPIVAGLLQGLSVALYTTAVGTVFNIWLSMNCRMLETGAHKLTVAYHG